MKRVSKINDLKSLVKSKAFSKLLMALALTGMVLISFPTGRKDDKKETSDANGYSQKYVRETEKRLTDILEKIDGVGDVSVMITLSSSEEVIYAQNEKESRDYSNDSDESNSLSKENSRLEKTYVFSDHGGRTALKISSTEPTIKGAVVVCSGGGDPVVRSKVTEACSIALGIRYGNIFVAKSN